MAPCPPWRVRYDSGQAPRQCDGDRLRCLLIVRDDFWMGLTRFLRDLGVEMVQGENIAAVDLFDPIHARRVLTAFGQAFTRLPSDLLALASEQQAFLDQAIEWLAQDGRVISVRLALFAEMVKRKPWTPTTLADAGSMERIGAAFLEETFRSASLRAHQKAAQAVLKALLPERGTDIKGHMRSFHELRMAPDRRIEPRGVCLAIENPRPRGSANHARRSRGSRSRAEEAKLPVAAEGQYYQLTHDYLVPSLREWLNSKLRETRRGCAEIRLAERIAPARPAAVPLPAVGLGMVPHPGADRQKKLDRSATADDEDSGKGPWHAGTGLLATDRALCSGWGSKAMATCGPRLWSIPSVEIPPATCPRSFRNW